MNTGSIGVFDSGYGGLTVLREFVKELPEYDYLYFGDNARTPYGPRSFETIYEFTLQCTRFLFDQGCSLVILACNTASAKALRNIQQKDLPALGAHQRVLGVIRPTAEIIGQHTLSGHVGVLGTDGTISSESYLMEIHKQYPYITVHQQACPMWVPLVENNEHAGKGADYFIEKYLHELFSRCDLIDTLLLACTHYPLLIDKIRAYVPKHVTILNQGEIVAPSLKDYLRRHPEISQKCSKNGRQKFLTTDSTSNFDSHASLFFGSTIKSNFVHL